MTTISISLPETLEAFIDEQVAARGYASASDYVSDLIRCEQERQRFRALIREGVDSELGEVADEAWFDSLREEIRNAGAS